MSAVVISYPPGAGGNHLKNLLCLHPGFANSSDLDINVYSEHTQPPGTVHSIPGRNIHEVFIDKIAENPDQQFVLHGHFGELALHRPKLQAVNKRFLLVSLTQSQDQQLLFHRQSRLGQHNHPYWLHEEQPWLYEPAMYQTYFDTHHNLTIPLLDLWHPSLQDGAVINQINEFLDIKIDVAQALDLHNKWWQLNFYFDFCRYTRAVYGLV